MSCVLTVPDANEVGDLIHKSQAVVAVLRAASMSNEDVTKAQLAATCWAVEDLLASAASRLDTATKKAVSR